MIAGVIGALFDVDSVVVTETGIGDGDGKAGSVTWRLRYESVDR